LPSGNSNGQNIIRSRQGASFQLIATRDSNSATLTLDANNPSDEITFSSTEGEIFNASSFGSIFKSTGIDTLGNDVDNASIMFAQDVDDIPATRNIVRIGTASGTSFSAVLDVLRNQATWYIPVYMSTNLVVNKQFELNDYDCSGNSNGGALTVGSDGIVVCSDDDSGGGGYDHEPSTVQFQLDAGILVSTIGASTGYRNVYVSTPMVVVSSITVDGPIRLNGSGSENSLRIGTTGGDFQIYGSGTASIWFEQNGTKAMVVSRTQGFNVPAGKSMGISATGSAINREIWIERDRSGVFELGFTGANYAGLQTGPTVVNSTEAASTSLKVVGVSGQTGNLTEWQDDGSNVLASVNQTGDLLTTSTFTVTKATTVLNGTTYYWPFQDDGDNGEVLTTNGSGTLSWTAAGTGDAILSATQTFSGINTFEGHTQFKSSFSVQGGSLPVVSSTWTAMYFRLTNNEDNDFAILEDHLSVDGSSVALKTDTFPASWPIIGSSDTYTVSGSSIPLWGRTHCDITISTISVSIMNATTDLTGTLEYTSSQDCLDVTSGTLIDTVTTGGGKMTTTGIADATVPADNCIFLSLGANFNNNAIATVSMEASCDSGP